MRNIWMVRWTIILALALGLIVIDFDYPYWHTIEDTCDKVSPESLERVGRVLEEWLEGE